MRSETKNLHQMAMSIMVLLACVLCLVPVQCNTITYDDETHHQVVDFMMKNIVGKEMHAYFSREHIQDEKVSRLMRFNADMVDRFLQFLASLPGVVAQDNLILVCKQMFKSPYFVQRPPKYGEWPRSCARKIFPTVRSEEMVSLIHLDADMVAEFLQPLSNGSPEMLIEFCQWLFVKSNDFRQGFPQYGEWPSNCALQLISTHFAEAMIPLIQNSGTIVASLLNDLSRATGGHGAMTFNSLCETLFSISTDFLNGNSRYAGWSEKCAEELFSGKPLYEFFQLNKVLEFPRDDLDIANVQRYGCPSLYYRADDQQQIFRTVATLITDEPSSPLLYVFFFDRCSNWIRIDDQDTPSEHESTFRWMPFCNAILSRPVTGDNQYLRNDCLWIHRNSASYRK